MADADREDLTSATAEVPAHGRVHGTVSALLAAGAGAAAIRTLVKQLAKRTLGPVGLLITAVEAAIAVRSGMRAVSRWRTDRRLRRSDAEPAVAHRPRYESSRARSAVDS